MKNVNIWSINTNIITIKVLISIILLTLGGLIYLGWRSEDLVMFQLLKRWGLYDLTISIRNIGAEHSLSDWIKYSMPDGLWLFSYMFLIDAIWYKYRYILYYIFLWSLPIIAIMSELLQYVAIVPGTFDIIDLTSYIFAIAIFIILKFT